MFDTSRQHVVVIAGRRRGDMGTIAGTLHDRPEFIQKILVNFSDGITPVMRNNLREATPAEILWQKEK